MAGYFSAIFKKEKEEIDQIGGEDDEKDKSVSEEAPAKTEELPTQEAPPAPPPAPPPPAAPPEAAPPAVPASATPAAQAAPPRAAGTPVPAAQAAPPRAVGTPVPAAQAAPPRAVGTPVPAETSKGKTPITIEEIKAFQKANGLTADGQAGPVTIDLMRKQGLYPTESGVKGLILAELNKAGIVSPAAIANIFATVQEESGFRSRSEEISEDRANKQYQNNPFLGNKEPGDGFKFRGRGLIQHTGRDQYQVLAKATGLDLINNPDLLNDPAIAAKTIPWFFLKFKSFIIKNIKDLDSIDNVNKAVAFHTVENKQGEKYQKRVQLAQHYLKDPSISSSGTQLAATGEMGQVTSGTTLASAGQTQYDKDKNSKTNVVIVPKANNKTNNIEESRKAA